MKLVEEAKKIKIFPKFLRLMEKTNIFKCKPPEVHFAIRNRMPYNKQLTNLACSSHTVEYWPSVVFVRTSLRSVQTVTTSVKYSPVRPSRSVSKRLIRGVCALILNLSFPSFSHFFIDAINNNIGNRNVSHNSGL